MAAAGEVATAGDVAGLCANEEIANNVANRIVARDVNAFIKKILSIFGLVVHRLRRLKSGKRKGVCQ